MSGLEVEDLTIAFPRQGGGWSPVVRGASLRLAGGEILGLVGESGSGKSLTALAILGLLPPAARLLAGRVRLDGRDLVGLPERELRRIRGARIGMVFQEPLTALNPVLPVGRQITEVLAVHLGLRGEAARREALRLLDLVALPGGVGRLGAYPHQLSGGQRQRVLLAVALAGRPGFLLADEPTTALDVTVQAQILGLLSELRRELGLGVLLVTHDLAVVAETCERAAVMYAGQIVEEGGAAALFAGPAHPYTAGLLRAVPRLGSPAPRGEMPVIPGQVAAPGEWGSGCAFEPRCPVALPRCAGEAPPRIILGAERTARCWLAQPEEIVR